MRYTGYASLTHANTHTLRTLCPSQRWPYVTSVTTVTVRYIRHKGDRSVTSVPKVAAASRALTEAAAAVDASLPVVEAAEAVRRAAANKIEEDDASNVHGSVVGKGGARRLWTADVREEVLAHDDFYQVSVTAA